MEKKRLTVTELKALLKQILEMNQKAIKNYESSDYFINSMYSNNEIDGLYTALLDVNLKIQITLK